MHAFKLFFPWQAKDGSSGCEVAEIEALSPLSHYKTMRRVRPAGAIIDHSQKNALWRAFVVRSEIAFADITGLSPCEDWEAVFGRDFHEPYRMGFNHTRLWRSAEHRYVATTEPCGADADKVHRWCAVNGWRFKSFSPAIGIGMWNPGGANETRFIVMSPPQKGAPIKPLTSALLELMPQWRDRLKLVTQQPAAQEQAAPHTEDCPLA